MYRFSTKLMRGSMATTSTPPGTVNAVRSAWPTPAEKPPTGAAAIDRRPKRKQLRGGSEHKLQTDRALSSVQRAQRFLLARPRNLSQRVISKQPLRRSEQALFRRRIQDLHRHRSREIHEQLRPFLVETQWLCQHDSAVTGISSLHCCEAVPTKARNTGLRARSNTGSGETLLAAKVEQERGIIWREHRAARHTLHAAEVPSLIAFCGACLLLRCHPRERPSFPSLHLKPNPVQRLVGWWSRYRVTYTVTGLSEKEEKHTHTERWIKRGGRGASEGESADNAVR
jgi:hypothetical protein